MKRHLNLTKTIILTVTLVFVVVGIANAGAVIRRGERDSSASKNSEKSTVRKSESQRSNGSNSSQNNSRSSSQRESRSDSRSNSRNDSRNDSRTYRPSDVQKPSRPSDATMRDRGAPDATPSYRKSDGSKYGNQDNRSYNSSNNNNRSNNYRPDMRDNRHGNEYNRVGERNTYRPHEKYDSRVTYKPPRYQGGYYYYNHGWPSRHERPLRYGYWVFDYVPDYSYRSVYYHYGYFPYIPFARIVVVKRPVVTYIEVPIVIKDSRYYESDYYLEQPAISSVGRALSDIRSAWLTNDPELILRHVRTDRQIHVLLDGDYAYSVDGWDYHDMTRDAIASISTIDFEYDSIRKRGDDRVIAYGKHRFFTMDGDRKTVYVSYELERRGSEWIITEVGSSLRQLH